MRHTLIQYLLQQNRLGTGEDETIEKEEHLRRYAGSMPLLTDLSLAMRTDPLALIRGASEFVTVKYRPSNERKGRLARDLNDFNEREARVENYTRIVLAPLGCKDFKVMHGEEEDQSAGKVVVPKFPYRSRNDEQGPSSSRKDQKRDD